MSLRPTPLPAVFVAPSGEIRPWRPPIPRVRTIRRLTVLTRREARIVQAVAETMFPSEGTGMPTVDEAEVVEYFDDLLVNLPFKEKALIRCLLALLEVQMLALNGMRPRFFSKASLAERTKNLSGWETSSIFQRRLVFMAIRTLLLWGYVDSNEAERDMGVAPGTRRTRERNQARLEAARRAIREANLSGEVSASETSGGPSPRRTSDAPGVRPSSYRPRQAEDQA